MKKLLILIMLTTASILSCAQVYRLDSLSAPQARLIRSAVVSLASDSTFWGNDSLINIIRSIDTQFAQGRTLFRANLNRAALVKVVEVSMGSLFNTDLQSIIQQRNRIRQDLREINTRIDIIRAIRKWETNRNLPRRRSIFEQLNTGFLDRSNFNQLDN